MEMELTVVPLGTDADGNEIVTFAFGPWPGIEHDDEVASSASGCTSSAARRRVGHGPGRRSRCAGRSPTPGCGWEDMQFAFGGSAAAGAADTMVSKLGLTGLQFINVANGCATGGSALFSAVNTILSGVFDLGIAIGFDKHERGAFRVDTRRPGWATGTARAAWRSRRSSSA